MKRSTATVTGDAIAPVISRAADVAAVCTLAAPRAGSCGWCGCGLPEGRRSWCGDRCAAAFRTNHWWSRARAAAKRRDRYACVRCGYAPPKRPVRAGYADDDAYRTAYRTWRSGRAASRLEVNHVAPALGAHRTLSCVHHLDNLETLCRACHALETRAQAAERAARRTAGAS